MAHLIPEQTDTMNRILQLFARYELCTDPSFYKMLSKNTKKIRRKKTICKKKKRRTKKSRRKQKKGKSAMMMIPD